MRKEINIVEKEIEVKHNENFENDANEFTNRLLKLSIQSITIDGVTIFNPLLMRDSRETYDRCIHIYDENGKLTCSFYTTTIKEIYGKNKDFFMIVFKDGKFNRIYVDLKEQKFNKITKINIIR